MCMHMHMHMHMHIVLKAATVLTRGCNPVYVPEVATVRAQVLVSVASLLDSSLAPEGGHVIHAYTPATEPYAT